jgi:hypothetical protein
VARLVDMASSETNASGNPTDSGPKLSQTRLYVLGLAISVTGLAVAFDTTILGNLFDLLLSLLSSGTLFKASSPV